MARKPPKKKPPPPVGPDKDDDNGGRMNVDRFGEAVRAEPFWAKIARGLAARGWPIRALADAIGHDPGRFSKWFEGTGKGPNWREARQMADALGLDMGWLTDDKLGPDDPVPGHPPPETTKPPPAPALSEDVRRLLGLLELAGITPARLVEYLLHHAADVRGEVAPTAKGEGEEPVVWVGGATVTSLAPLPPPPPRQPPGGSTPGGDSPPSAARSSPRKASAGGSRPGS